jgi:hypothetical protein
MRKMKTKEPKEIKERLSGKELFPLLTPPFVVTEVVVPDRWEEIDRKLNRAKVSIRAELFSSLSKYRAAHPLTGGGKAILMARTVAQLGLGFGLNEYVTIGKILKKLQEQGAKGFAPCDSWEMLTLMAKLGPFCSDTLFVAMEPIPAGCECHGPVIIMRRHDQGYARVRDIEASSGMTPESKIVLRVVS